MLFIIFINDNSNITVKGVLAKLYADDLNMYISLILTDVSHNLQDVTYYLIFLCGLRTGN